MFSLAHNYGFTEKQILWEIPFTRILRYMHAAMWANGAWTVKRREVSTQEISRLMELTNAIPEDEGEDYSDF